MASPVEDLPHTADPNVEFTSAAKIDQVAADAAPGFEPTVMQMDDSGSFHATAGDPALVTDAAEMATAFPTKFGIEGATIDPVGVAADMPQLYADSAPATEKTDFDARVAAAMESYQPAPEAAAPSGWKAEETGVGHMEHGVSLHEEMQKAFAAAAPPPEPAAEPMRAVQATAALPVSENAPDLQLAAAMAAAVGAEMAPVVAAAVPAVDSTIPIDQHTALIAEIVHRVTERMKPDLVAEIAKEFAAEMHKKKS